MNENEVPINQTQFSFEEPIFENQVDYQQEKLQDSEPAKPRSKKKLLIVGTSIFVVILLVIILAASSMRKGNDPSDVAVPNEVVIKQLGPIQQRIEDARDLLEVADPAKQDLAFPPIDLQLRLDPKVK